MKDKKQRRREDEEFLQELEHYEAPRRKRKRIDQRYVLAGVLGVLSVAGLLFSPLFSAKEVLLEGCEHYTTSEITQQIGFQTGDNIIFYNTSKAERLLEEDPYIAEAKLSRRLPDKLVISITERKVRGYVPYMGSYLYIDEEGRVLDTQEAYFDSLPEVKGLQFSYFKLGEVLPVENEEALLAVLQMSQMMKKYELLDVVVEMDVSDPKDIYLNANQVSIHIGQMSDGDQKIRIMAEIMKTIPEGDRGTLDLSDLNKPIVFKYLT